MTTELCGVDLTGVTELIDPSTGSTSSTVVVVENRCIEAVLTDVQLEWSTEQVVELKVVVLVGAIYSLDDLLGVFDRHDRRTSARLCKTHSVRCRSIEQNSKYSRLIQTTDINHVTHDEALSASLAHKATSLG